MDDHVVHPAPYLPRQVVPQTPAASTGDYQPLILLLIFKKGTLPCLGQLITWCPLCLWSHINIRSNFPNNQAQQIPFRRKQRASQALASSCHGWATVVSLYLSDLSFLHLCTQCLLECLFANLIRVLPPEHLTRRPCPQVEVRYRMDSSHTCIE